MFTCTPRHETQVPLDVLIIGLLHSNAATDIFTCDSQASPRSMCRSISSAQGPFAATWFGAKATLAAPAAAAVLTFQCEYTYEFEAAKHDHESVNVDRELRNGKTNSSAQAK